MDDALRHAERSAEWEARARALRRAGDEGLARCWVAAAARAGLPRASAVLGAEYPLDRDAEYLLRLLEDASHEAWGDEGPHAAEILIGDGDPRLSTPGLAWLEGHQARRGASLGLDDVPRGLVIPDHLARVALLLHDAGPGLDRTRLLPHELRDLLQSLDRDLDLAGRLRLIALVDEAEDEGLSYLLDTLLSCPDPEAQERVRTLDQGRAGGCLPSGLPWRPDWVRSVHRDSLTLALSRAGLRPRGRSPIAFELPDTRWIGLFDLDLTQELNNRFGHIPGDEVLCRVTGILQAIVGDRVIRYGGDEWLICYEGEEAQEIFERCLESVASDPWLLKLVAHGPSPSEPWIHDPARSVTLSGGAVRRTGSSPADIEAADQALLEAKLGGRGRLVFADDKPSARLGPAKGA